MLSKPRKILKVFHLEGIPAVGSFFYNKISSTKIFHHHYELVADDICSYVRKGKILDIGTGPGRLLLSLYRKGYNQLSGIDVSSSMIQQAKKNIEHLGLGNRIELTKASAADMPFPDNHFDLVVSTGSIHHWKDTDRCLDEIYRVLKQKKYALIYDLVSDTPKSVLRQLRKDYGRVRTWLFWLHGFEEPFYSCKEYSLIPKSSHFKQGQTKFVGALCCLILKKS